MKAEYQPQWLTTNYPQIINGGRSVQEVVAEQAPSLSDIITTAEATLGAIPELPGIEELRGKSSDPCFASG